MAGYNVQTPPLFTVRDPQQLVQFNLNTLNAGYTFRDKETVIDSQGTGGVTYTADAILGGYIIRRGSGLVTDDLDTASNILDEIYRKLLSIGNNDNLPNGSTVTCTLYIDQGPTAIVGNDGIEVCGGFLVDPYCAVEMTLIIVDQARLNTATDNSHSDQIRVCICGAYEAPFLTPLTKGATFAAPVKGAKNAPAP
jgi:hypothetical protein